MGPLEGMAKSSEIDVYGKVRIYGSSKSAKRLVLPMGTIEKLFR